MLLEAKAKMNSSKNVKRYLIKIIVKHFFYPKIYVGEKVSSQIDDAVKCLTAKSHDHKKYYRSDVAKLKFAFMISLSIESV